MGRPFGGAKRACLGLLLVSAGAAAGAPEDLAPEAASLRLTREEGGFRAEIRDPAEPGRERAYVFPPDDGSDGADARQADGGEVIRVPVRRIVSLSTTYLGPLEALGALDRVVAVDDSAHVFSSVLRERVASGEIREVGSVDRLDIESLLAARPDLVLLTRISPGRSDLEQRLRSAGIPVLVTAAWRETTPLGRSEWIKLFGILTGREEEAFRIFRESRARYEALAAKVRAADSARPRILLSAPYGGTWYVPGGASYTASLIEAAGGDYLWSANRSTGSFPLDLEAVLARGLEADFWINPGRHRSLAALARSDERFQRLPAFREGRVYNRTRRVGPAGGNDFWESGAVRPDRILADLIAILHPGLLPDHRFVYYEKLPE